VTAGYKKKKDVNAKDHAPGEYGIYPKNTLSAVAHKTFPKGKGYTRSDDVDFYENTDGGQGGGEDILVYKREHTRITRLHIR
jgi:hypothetical protein